MKKHIIRVFVLFLLAAVLAVNLMLILNRTKHTPDLSAPTESSPEVSVPDKPAVPEVVTETDTPVSSTDEPEKPVDLNQYATVTEEKASLRASDSSKAELLANVEIGEKLIVLESKDKWYKVDFNGQIGWISADSLELIRNRELEATLYSPIPEFDPDIIQSLSGTATAKYIDQIASKQNADGVSVAVITSSKVAYHYEYGYADLEHTRKVTVNTKFRAASLTKVFTAMLAMKLSEDSVLDLDEDFGAVYGKSFRNPKYKNSTITTRMLLTHTSSFKDKDPIFEGSLFHNLEDKNSYSASRPGVSFLYSNFGYGVAGAVVEKASGMVLSEYADKAFFEDMDIDGAYNGAYLDETTDVADCIKGTKMGLSAAGVVKERHEYNPGYNFSAGAGNLIITAVDMGKIYCVLSSNGIYDGQRYLKKETVSEMFKKQYNTKGFDQCIALRRSENVIAGRQVYYHTGSAYGIFTFAVFDPSDSSGVIVFSTGANDSEDSNGVRKVCSDIASLVYEDVFDSQA